MSMLSDQLKGSPLGPLMYDPTDDKEAALGGLGQIQAAYGNLNVPGYTPIKNVFSMMVSVFVSSPIVRCSISMKAGWRSKFPANRLRVSI